MGPRRTPAPHAAHAYVDLGVLESLEEILLPALSRTPCLVAFSGGRDSSAVLAVATHTARRCGLDDPIPITMRYGAHPRTHESEWQEAVVRHLGLADWQTLSVRDEFDFLGPIGSQALRRHGLYWPSNAHTMIPLLRAAAQGTLLTGNGGDEVFTSLVRPAAMTRVQMLQMLPLKRGLATVVVSLLPLSLKVRAQYQRVMRLPWLRRSASREVMSSFVANAVRKRRGEVEYLDELARGRYLELTLAAFAAFAEDTDAHLIQPFLDPRFFRAIRKDSPPGGFQSRGAAMDAFFGQLLPPAVTRRTTKASFTEVFWGPASRDFARDWDGSGLDPALVDPHLLRREWVKPRPDARSTTPLQAAWLATAGSA